MLTNYVNNIYQLCDEERKIIDMSNTTDVTLPTIVSKDISGRNFDDQRSAWREGSSFPFTAEFYGIAKVTTTPGSADISSATEISSPLLPDNTESWEGSVTNNDSADSNIIDTEIVDTPVARIF